MKLVSLSRFKISETNFNFDIFMGRYSQLTNALSLLLSFRGFPILMKNFGVCLTLRLFPMLLVTITVLTSTILPPKNVWILFVSMALLKAMTYSINKPVKHCQKAKSKNHYKFSSSHQCFFLNIMLVLSMSP